MNLLILIIKKVFDLFKLFTLTGVEYAKYKGVNVGNNCRLYTTSWGSEPFLIKIGDSVTITSGVKIITHDGSTCLVKNEAGKRYFKYAEVSIGNNVFIGVNSIILPGVEVCDNVIIAAGSVVPKSINKSGVYGGNPARFICSFEDYEKKIRNSCPTKTEFNEFDSYQKNIIAATRFYNERQ